MAGKPKPVPEWEAKGEIRRVYDEIKPTLRVSIVKLNFQAWAGFPAFLPAMWDAIRPNAGSRAFEEAGDRVRSEAVGRASALGRLGVREGVRLGRAQAEEIARSLDLYHYINPKLLVYTAAVRLALKGEASGGGGPGIATDPLARGVPAGMIRPKMVPEKPGSTRLRELFRDIKRTLKLPSVNSDYRTLAYWPDYLEAVWEALKPIAQGKEHARAADHLRRLARTEARALPYPVDLTAERVGALGEDAEQVLAVTRQFERLLPGLILNVALVSLDWKGEEELLGSPFPAAARESPAGAVW